MIRFVDLKTPEEERKMFAILTYHKKICARDLGWASTPEIYTAGLSAFKKFTEAQMGKKCPELPCARGSPQYCDHIFLLIRNVCVTLPRLFLLLRIDFCLSSISFAHIRRRRRNPAAAVGPPCSHLHP